MTCQPELPEKGISPAATSNQVSEHQHAYEVMGSGSSCWAECACGHKLNRGNGVVVGSRQKIEREIADLGAGA